MLALRIIAGLGLAYLLLLVLAWLFQDPLAFPAPRASLPDPKRVGVENGEGVELVSRDGAKVVGWHLAPNTLEVGGGRGGLGESAPHHINLPHPPPTSPTYTAAHRRVAGLIVESPFTNAAAVAKHHYGLLPRFLLRLSLDNVANVKRVHCPILLFHGDADRLVPTAMGMAVAAAAAGPVEVVLIHGSGHNDTYDIGGRAYRDKMWRFIGRTVGLSDRTTVRS